MSLRGVSHLPEYIPRHTLASNFTPDGSRVKSLVHALRDSIIEVRDEIGHQVRQEAEVVRGLERRRQQRLVEAREALHDHILHLRDDRVTRLINHRRVGAHKVESLQWERPRRCVDRVNSCPGLIVLVLPGKSQQHVQLSNAQRSLRELALLLAVPDARAVSCWSSPHALHLRRESAGHQHEARSTARQIRCLGQQGESPD
jgi:hypothetical protein